MMARMSQDARAARSTDADNKAPTFTRVIESSEGAVKVVFTTRATAKHEFLEVRGWWSQAKEEKLREVERANVLVALEKAEHKDKPALDTMFEDVYKVMPTHLARQQAEMLAHVAKYPDQYPVGGH